MIPDPETLADARVLLVGDVMLDRYWTGGTKRISPEAPVPVVDVSDFRDLPGGAANVALNVASLGTPVSLIGMVGADSAADALRQGLDAAGVRHALVTVAASPTITKMRVLSRNQHLMRLDIEDGFAAVDHAPLLEQVRAHVGSADVVIVSDYAKGTLGPAVGEVIRSARAAGCRVLVDPKGEDFERYRGAHLITPNRGELERVVGRCADDAQIEARARELIGELDIEGLLITRSEEGMSLVPRQGSAIHLPAHRREVYDVTGAGDTVIGVLAALLAAGLEMHSALALANHAAGIVVGHLGAAQVTLDELRAAVASEAQTVDRGGVLALEELLPRLEAARGRGETIVLTNGCFDLLHVGHVRGLQAMRARGDRLVVAVNDDASVRRLKGEGRPLVPLVERMELLAALACVDYVVAFSQDTPAALIERVRPDVLAKGGDYAPSEIAGHDAVVAAGGRVEVLDYIAGRSTTALLDQIRGGG